MAGPLPLDTVTVGEWMDPPCTGRTRRDWTRPTPPPRGGLIEAGTGKTHHRESTTPSRERSGRSADRTAQPPTAAPPLGQGCRPPATRGHAGFPHRTHPVPAAARRTTTDRSRAARSPTESGDCSRFAEAGLVSRFPAKVGGALSVWRLQGRVPSASFESLRYAPAISQCSPGPAKILGTENRNVTPRPRLHQPPPLPTRPSPTKREPPSGSASQSR